METLEERVANIEKRNVDVTLDKRWEISWFRRLSVGALTYVVIGVFLSMIGVLEPWVTALVPVIGFLLSTLTLGFIKASWIKNK